MKQDEVRVIHFLTSLIAALSTTLSLHNVIGMQPWALGAMTVGALLAVNLPLWNRSIVHNPLLTFAAACFGAFCGLMFLEVSVFAMIVCFWIVSTLTLYISGTRTGDETQSQPS